MKGMAIKSAVSEYLAEIGRKGGKASGKARMEKLTPEQRSEVARQAATARWTKAKKQSPSEKRPGK
jgi:general stress protein YciG